MKGQVRGLALELLRQDCVDSLDKAQSLYELGSGNKTYTEAERKAIVNCKLYDNALHKEAKNNDH